MRREFLDHLPFWHARDPEQKPAHYEVYNAARANASLDGRTPLTFVGHHLVKPADLSRVRWELHCRGLVQLPVAA